MLVIRYSIIILTNKNELKRAHKPLTKIFFIVIVSKHYEVVKAAFLTPLNEAAVTMFCNIFQLQGLKNHFNPKKAQVQMEIDNVVCTQIWKVK